MSKIPEITVPVTLDLGPFCAALDDAHVALEIAKLEARSGHVTPRVDGPRTPFQIGGARGE